MTNEQVTGVCGLLRFARDSLKKTKDARADAIATRTRDFEDGLKYVDDPAAAGETLKGIYDDLNQLTAVQPVRALIAAKMPERAAPTLLPGVIEAMEQIAKANAILQGTGFSVSR
jgi:hypothetical protein